MKSFQKPYEIVDCKGVRFVLFDGSETKSIFGALKFDNNLGVFPIINNNNEVVEYMDIVGNFTKQPTKFAKEFNIYINSTIDGVGYGNPECFVYSTSLIDFPSKYLVNRKIRQIVKQEEKFKFVKACKNGDFRSLLDKLNYKLYCLKIYNKKIDRMKHHLKHKESELEKKEYFEL